MPIEFACPNGHVLKAPEERAGKTGKCPKCGVAFLVPELEEPVEDFAAAEPPPDEAAPAGSSPSGVEAGGAAESGVAAGARRAPNEPSGAAPPSDANPADLAAAAATATAAASDPPSEETITFLCPNGHKLTSPARLQGKAGKCPHCGEKFRVPSLDEMEDDVDEFGVEEEVPAFGAEDQFGGAPGVFGDELDVAVDEIPQEAMVEEELGPPHPMRLLFERLWREREHGGRVRLQLAGGVSLEADFYARAYSRGGYGVVASRDEKGNYRIAAIQWDAVERIEVDELVNLPEGVFE